MISGGRPGLLTGPPAPTSQVTIYGWSTSEASPRTAEVSNDVIGKPQQ